MFLNHDVQESVKLEQSHTILPSASVPRPYSQVGSTYVQPPPLGQLSQVGGIWQASSRIGQAHVIVVEPGDFQIQRLITDGIITHVEWSL